MLQHERKRTPTNIRIRPPDSTDNDIELPKMPRWLTVDQIRKMQRMRRESVLDAMQSGELPYEQRGRIRYARLTDVLAWEQRRVQKPEESSRLSIRSELTRFL